MLTTFLCPKMFRPNLAMIVTGHGSLLLELDGCNKADKLSEYLDCDGIHLHVHVANFSFGPTYMQISTTFL